MLAACRAWNWPIENYIAAEHPLQEKIRSIVARGCGETAPQLELATDGCSLPTFAAPILQFAFAYAVLADPVGAKWDGLDSERAALRRLREAMTLHPDLISGEGEIDTVIMQETNGRVVAKLGAEGLLCLAIPGHRLGVAISDAGGSTRSLGPAAVAVLGQLGLEDDMTIATLKEKLCPPVRSFAGNEVGEIRASLTLELP
jgi:L-asparaginase II